MQQACMCAAEAAAPAVPALLLLTLLMQPTENSSLCSGIRHNSIWPSTSRDMNMMQALTW